MNSETLTAADPGEVGLVRYEDFEYTQPFTCKDGHTLPGFTLRYETYGRLNKDRSNAILVCHALSGDHHCAGVYSLNDRKPGWWNNMIGPHKPIDTEKYFVICSNCLGGCQGSTGPSSINPESGKPYHLDFPEITIEDMVRAQELLLREHLALSSVYAVIGGSMGGMQVLQWAISFPGHIQRYMALATTARHSTQAIAFDEVGRQAIINDPDWKEGRYETNGGPNVGLAIARMMAHITYLSDEGMERKFGRAKREKDSRNPFDVEFEVESYLRYQGQSFINRFDANTYLYFSKALDRFDLFAPTGRLEDNLIKAEGRFLIVGFTSDWLYPPEQNRAIAHALLRSGKHATFAEIPMDFGHDSFLVEAPDLYEIVQNFLIAPE